MNSQFRLRFALIFLSILFCCLIGLSFFSVKRKYHLSFSTGQEGGLYHPIGEAISELLESQLPNFKVKTMPSVGSAQTRDFLSSGKADLGIIQNDTLFDERVKTVFPLYDEVLYIVVSSRSNISSLHDVKGKRFSLGLKNSGTFKLSSALLSHFGVALEDFSPLFLDMKRASQALLKGEVDGLFFMSGLKPDALVELFSSGEVKLIGLGDFHGLGNVAEGFCFSYPFTRPFIVPVQTFCSKKDGFVGEPLKPVITLSTPALLVCRRDLPSKVVKRIAETVWNHQGGLVQAFPFFLRSKLKVDPSFIQFPFHEGAFDFQNRKRPGFLVVYAEVIGLFLSSFLAFISLVITVYKWLLQKKKDRIDSFYDRVNNIMRAISDESLDVPKLLLFQQDLEEIRRKAFEELMDEKLLSNESFRIFQTLVADCQKQLNALLNEKKTLSESL